MRFAAALLSAVVLTGLLGASPAHAEGSSPDLVSSLPSVVRGSHRTAALEGPEGTTAGLDAALAGGSKVLDLDLRVLADGEVVVSHDSTTTRLTTSRRSVAGLTLAGWTGLVIDVRAWFGAALPVAPLTFRQVLADYAGRAVILAEVKTAATLPAAVALVHETGSEGSVILQSNNPDVVRQVKDAGLHANLWRSPGQIEGDDPATWAASGAEQLIVQNSSSAAQLAKALTGGLPVWVCGVNNPARAAALLGQGVRGLLSDAPAYTFGRTAKRRSLPLVQLGTSLTLRRGTVGYVTGSVMLPATGNRLSGVAVAATVGGVTWRTRSTTGGAFKVKVRAPTKTGAYRIGLASSDITVTQDGSELQTWRLTGTRRVDGGVPVLTVVR